MKCIKKNNGQIIRVGDSTARKLVLMGQGIYVPKSEWKKVRAVQRKEGHDGTNS